MKFCIATYLLLEERRRGVYSGGKARYAQQCADVLQVPRVSGICLVALY